MAKVWFCYEGPKLTRRKSSYELPTEECVEKLGISYCDFLSNREHPPTFVDPEGLGEIAGYKQVLVELGKNDAASICWRPGFYRLLMMPAQVIEQMGQPPKDPLDANTASSARLRCAVRRVGHIPNDHAAMKLLYLVLNHAA